MEKNQKKDMLLNRLDTVEKMSSINFGVGSIVEYERNLIEIEEIKAELLELDN